nr:hypothetical protein [Tanacetum cinerariifolium]
MFTTIKLVFRHQDTQQYDAILPIELTNEAIINSKSYKEYYAISLRAEPPKTKASVKKKQSTFDTTMPPPTAKGKRLKTSAKVDKPTKEKQSAKTSKAKGLTVLSEVALTEAEQMKLAIKRSLTKTHISYASGSGAYKGTGIIPGVPDVPTYESDDEEISWKSSTRLSTSAKRKQPAKSSKAKGLSVLSEVALTEAEQIKLAIKRSLQQIHISQASRSNADKGTGIIPGVPDVPTDESNEEISWKSSDKDDDDVDDQNNDGDDFVHPKLSTHDKEAKDEESFDPIVQTPSHVENSDDESHGMNVGGDEGPDVEDDDEELYRDVNINLEGRDIQMTDVHTTQ